MADPVPANGLSSDRWEGSVRSLAFLRPALRVGIDLDELAGESKATQTPSSEHSSQALGAEEFAQQKRE